MADDASTAAAVGGGLVLCTETAARSRRTGKRFVRRFPPAAAAAACSTSGSFASCVLAGLVGIERGDDDGWKKAMWVEMEKSGWSGDGKEDNEGVGEFLGLVVRWVLLAPPADDEIATMLPAEDDDVTLSSLEGALEDKKNAFARVGQESLNKFICTLITTKTFNDMYFHLTATVIQKLIRWGMLTAERLAVKIGNEGFNSGKEPCAFQFVAFLGRQVVAATGGGSTCEEVAVELRHPLTPILIKAVGATDDYTNSLLALQEVTSSNWFRQSQLLSDSMVVSMIKVLHDGLDRWLWKDEAREKVSAITKPFTPILAKAMNEGQLDPKFLCLACKPKKNAQEFEW